MAPEIATQGEDPICEPASRKKPTLPSCVGGGHRVPHHRTSRGAARRHQRDRDATHNGVREPASRKKPTLPSCVGGGHRVPRHRTSRGEARRHQRDWDAMHMATKIVLYVSGRTTDVSRTVPIRESYTLCGVAHSAHLRKLHSVSRHPCSSTCHNLWCTTFTCGAPLVTYSAPSAVSYAFLLRLLLL